MLYELIASSMIGTLCAIFALYALSFTCYRSEHEFWATIMLLGMFGLLHFMGYLNLAHLEYDIEFLGLYLAIGVGVSFLKWHSLVKDAAVDTKERIDNLLANSQVEMLWGFTDKTAITSFRDPRFIAYYVYKYCTSPLYNLILRQPTPNTNADPTAAYVASLENHVELFLEGIRPSAMKEVGKISTWVTYWPLTFIEHILFMIGDMASVIVKYFGNTYTRITKSAFKID